MENAPRAPAINRNDHIISEKSKNNPQTAALYIARTLCVTILRAVIIIRYNPIIIWRRKLGYH